MIRPLPPGWTRPVEVAEGTDALREALGQQVLNALLRSRQQPNSGDLALEVADALLAGPLAPLLAKVQAVEALAEEIEDESMYGENGVTRREIAGRIRRALNGESRG